MKQRLINALTMCAKAHKVEFTLYDEDKDDVQFAFMSTKMPLVADVEMIVEAFYGRYSGIVHVDYGWGFSDVLLDCFPMLDNVNEELLKMALPRGAKP